MKLNSIQLKTIIKKKFTNPNIVYYYKNFISQMDDISTQLDIKQFFSILDFDKEYSFLLHKYPKTDPECVRLLMLEKLLNYRNRILIIVDDQMLIYSSNEKIYIDYQKHLQRFLSSVFDKCNDIIYYHQQKDSFNNYIDSLNQTILRKKIYFDNLQDIKIVLIGQFLDYYNLGYIRF
jgi:hypothetical protein